MCSSDLELRIKKEVESRHPHLEQLGKEEVAALVEQHQQADGEHEL
mgnify:CR=1 FL=1